MVFLKYPVSVTTSQYIRAIHRNIAKHSLFRPQAVEHSKKNEINCNTVLKKIQENGAQCGDADTKLRPVQLLLGAPSLPAIPNLHHPQLKCGS
jgi:hypothetical protein